MVLLRQMCQTGYSRHFPIWLPRKHNSSNNSKTSHLNSYIIETNFDDKKELYHMVYCTLCSIIKYGGKNKMATKVTVNFI